MNVNALALQLSQVFVISHLQKLPNIILLYFIGNILVAFRCFNVDIFVQNLFVRIVMRQPSHNVAFVGLSIQAWRNMQCTKFFWTGLQKCAKVNDYNLETVEVTSVVIEAKENSFPAVTSELLCKCTDLPQQIVCLQLLLCYILRKRVLKGSIDMQ